LSTTFILQIRIPLFASTFVRLPGYPLSIGGVYALFGDGNNAALFLVRGVLDTLTCVLVGMLAWMWSPEKWQNRRAALAAFLLAVACPFTVIYSAVLLTETITMFLSAANSKQKERIEPEGKEQRAEENVHWKG
jgi:hypothetical protein